MSSDIRGMLKQLDEKELFEIAKLKKIYQNEPDDEDFIGNTIAGFSEGNLCHIRSRKIRNTIQVRTSINVPNDPGRKAPVVFIEA